MSIDRETEPASPSTGDIPRIGHLGHVGIFVEDLDAEVAFYRDVLGLQVTDSQPDMGITFMSSQPEIEHHELLLSLGRTSSRDALMVQQIAWRCDSLDDVIAFHYRLKDCNVPLDMEVSHGNAIGIYFYDPEGNRNEVYWSTGLKATQAYLASVDLEAPPEEILQRVKANVDVYGSSGFIEPGFMEQMQIGSGD